MGVGMRGSIQTRALDRWAEILFLLLPAAFWLGMFWDFLSGQIVVNVDTNANYTIYKYLFNNLLNGVVPLWNPYINSGVPNVLIASVGLLNPLIAALSLLHFAGFNYYQIFILYLVIYYFLGALGFYLLARQIFSEKSDALLAYWLLLFSGMGAMLFNQIYLLQIFVTAVWFFYFLFRFARRFSKRDFAGMVFVLMVMTYSYLPPYFIVCFVLFGFSWGCLFPAQIKDFFRGVGHFIKKEYRGVGLSLVLLFVAAGAFVVTQQGYGRGDLFLLGRHTWGTVPPANLESPRMTLNETAFFGTLGERMVGGRILSQLDKFPYTSDFLFYLPIWVYLVIVLACFVDFDRKRFVLLFLITTLYLLSLGAAFSVYPFLFSGIPFFQYFRNLFLYSAFLLPLLILLAVSQWRALLQVRRTTVSQKGVGTIVMSLLHLALGGWMWAQGNVLTSSYVTVALSWLLTILIIWDRVFMNRYLLMLSLLTLCLIEPWEVFAHYRFNAASFRCRMPAQHVVPEFSYSRSGVLADNDDSCRMLKTREYQEYWHGMEMRDSDGLSGNKPLVISKWTCLLERQNVEKEDFRKYVRHKIWVYDNVRTYLDTPQDREDFYRIFKERLNLAFVFGEPQHPISIGRQADRARTKDLPAQAVSADSEPFHVLHFDVNQVSLATNFAQRKFLVYTDSYNQNWRVFVNGQPQKLYRANVAFKGVLLPPGKNVVAFRYDPPGGSAMYGGALVAQCVMLWYLISLLRQEKNG